MDRKALVAYYSQSGNTQRIAEMIQHEVSGDLYEIVPEKAYKSLYLGGGTRIKKERENGILPKLSTPMQEIKPYEVIFLGTPNWGNSLSHPVIAFMNYYDFAGKIIVPFCTHGGGGAGHIEADIKTLCPQVQVTHILEIYGNGSFGTEANIKKWIGEFSK